MGQSASHEREGSWKHPAVQPPAVLWIKCHKHLEDAAPHERGGLQRSDLLHVSEEPPVPCNRRSEQYFKGS